VRLTELDPQWLNDDAGRRIGFVFLCPTRAHNGKCPNYQSCFFSPTPAPVQRAAVERAGLDWYGGQQSIVQLCKEECGWISSVPVEQATFETMTVSPSIDGSAGGNWHGYITNGQIVGGIP
jgi:hypothetical protein